MNNLILSLGVNYPFNINLGIFIKYIAGLIEMDNTINFYLKCKNCLRN